VIDQLTTKLRQTPDRIEQRTLAKKIVDREYDQVLRMWMPYADHRAAVARSVAGEARGTSPMRASTKSA